MKKPIKPEQQEEPKVETDVLTDESSEPIEQMKDESAKEKDSGSRGEKCRQLDFSFCNIISTFFLIFLVLGVMYRFVFPTINSFEAGMTNKKVGKSIVYNYFSLLENSRYTEALKLMDVGSIVASPDVLADMIKREFGTTNIVGCDILDVKDTSEYSIVHALVSYVDKGVTQSRKQSMLLKNTPDGWRISLDGMMKKFNLEPFSMFVGSNGDIELKPEEIEYCAEGINLRINISNISYKQIPMKGDITLITQTGGFSASLNTSVKPKVSYDHNILFTGADGVPKKILLNLQGKGYSQQELPVQIRR